MNASRSAIVTKTPLVIALVLALSLFVTSAAWSAPVVGADFGPSVAVTQLHGTKREAGSVTSMHWLASGRFRSQATTDIGTSSVRTVLDMAAGTVALGNGFPSAMRNVDVIRNTTSAAPEGYGQLDIELMNYAWPLVARQRSGVATLTLVTSGGAEYLRGTIALAANDCAGYQAGTRTVLLDPQTLLVRRVIDRRAGKVERDVRFTPRAARTGDFAPLRIIGARTFRNGGYVRRTPAKAAALLSVPISMPASVPTGFRVEQTGFGALGARIGPEGSFPQSKGVYFARWVRGMEALDFTIRKARATLIRDWDESDPFGAECTAPDTSQISVGSATARYAVGEDGPPRLWWRNGASLYTLSGPFAAEQLATIARSLAPIA